MNFEPSARYCGKCEIFDGHELDETCYAKNYVSDFFPTQ